MSDSRRCWDSSGVHFASVLKRLGVEDEVRAKPVLAAAGFAVAELVRTGDVAVVATQAMADAANAEAAAAFAAYIGTSGSRAQLEQAGLAE